MTGPVQRAAARWPVLIGFTLATALATIALVLVIAQQKHLSQQTVRLNRVVAAVQDQRKSSVNYLCDVGTGVRALIRGTNGRFKLHPPIPTPAQISAARCRGLTSGVNSVRLP